MRQFFRPVVLVLILFLVTNYGLLVTSHSARADEYEDLQKLLDQKISELQNRQKEQNLTQTQKDKINQNVNEVKSLVARANLEIEKKKKQIINLGVEKDQKEKELAQKVAARDLSIKSLYKTSAVSPLDLFLGSGNFAELSRSLTYYKLVVLEGLRRTENLGSQVIKLKVTLLQNRERKDELDREILSLSQKKKVLDEKLVGLASQLSSINSQISNLQGDIARISSRQRQLLAEKTGSFQTTVGEVPAADDPKSRLDYDPGFRPAFAGFSFGAPHRKGLSQYGAYGRAKNGQNYQEILKAYYGNVGIETRDLPGSIKTTVGTYSLEDNYLLGIAEMPSSWANAGGFEALKAQAVAARSYAMVAGKPICISESCQVYSSSKASNPPDAWRRAVAETRGQVVVAGGSIVTTYYAASSGGFNTPGGWDTKCGNQSCWTGEAYEKLAESPWFYKAWYKPRRSSATRAHPWLNAEEFVDIVNAVLLFGKESGSIAHLSQTDKSNPDTWSREEVRRRLGGEVLDNVSLILVTYSGGGHTSTVHLQTDKGGKDFDGEIFRQIFNLRAPGEIWLASSLYNIERK